MDKGTGTILVVDDDPDTCANLSDLFADLGYRVDTAHDGASALAHARQLAYDVALVDWKMPGMDGLTLCRALGELHPATVSVMITGYVGGTLAEEARSIGVRRILSKPVDFPRLQALVNEVLACPLVLVVDDEADFCASLRDVLREHGYRVSLARDEDQARERLQGRAFQIVLIDMKLPNGDGASVYRRVRASCPGARTVVITGYPAETNHVVQQLLTDGADALFYKPLDVSRLLAGLQTLMN